MNLLNECRQYRGMKAEAAVLRYQLQAQEQEPGADRVQLEQLHRRIEELTQHCANVEKAIASAPDATLRAAMMMHYQLGIHWKAAASEIGGELMADALRKRVYRFLSER